jgi:hypothetical protein
MNDSIIPALQEYIYRAQFPFETAEWAQQRAAALLEKVRELEETVARLTGQQGAA